MRHTDKHLDHGVSTMLHIVRRLAAPLAVALPLLFSVSCGSQPTDPTEDSAIPAGQAQLLLAVNVSATSISTLVVEVTAPDITTPLIFNIEESGGVATGTLTIPAGSDRTITIRAFDSNGIETHRGSITIDVVEGTNPNVSITLLPLTGEQPVTASFGSFAVIVNPPSATVAVGATVQLTATVLDANGDPTSDVVAWASSNPGIAGVDASGLVTGKVEGSVDVVATFNGVGGSAAVTVVEGASPITWTLQTSNTSEMLHGVWAASPDIVFAVGGGGTILRYDGGNWAPQASNTNQTLLGVWGTSPTDVFAVGTQGTILHYDGNVWSPQPSGTPFFLADVWGSSAGDVFAVGGRCCTNNGAIVHYDGTNWNPQNSGVQVSFQSAHGTGPTDVFAVGDSQKIVHYDGNTWTLQLDGTTGLGLTGLWVLSASDAFAVGVVGTIFRYNGVSWDPMDSGSTAGFIDTWGSAANDMYAVGTGNVHFDGNEWSPVDFGTSEFIRSISGTSGSDVWVVGNAGVIIHGTR